MKSILLILVALLSLLSLAACGGGGGGGGGSVSTPTTATLKIDLTGTLPAATTISGADFTLTLPANVTPALSSGAVAAGVVTPTGTFASSTPPPLFATYTVATLSTPGTLRVTLTNSAVGGVNQVGEVATIILQLASGAAPTAGSFGLSAVSVIDAPLSNTINGMGATIASVTLR